MTEGQSTFDAGVQWQIAEADSQIARLTALSDELYATWGSDAAFYALRAAASVVLTPAHAHQLRAIAIRRRDEPGCTVAEYDSYGELAERLAAYATVPPTAEDDDRAAS